jgi:hypothetical protein
VGTDGSVDEAVPTSPGGADLEVGGHHSPPVSHTPSLCGAEAQEVFYPYVCSFISRAFYSAKQTIIDSCILWRSMSFLSR